MITFHEFDALEVLTPLKAKAFPELAKTFERLRKFAMKHNFPIVFVGSQRQPKSTGDFIDVCGEKTPTAESDEPTCPCGGG